MKIYNWLRMALCHPFFMFVIYLFGGFQSYAQDIPPSLITAIHTSQRLETNKSRKILLSLSEKNKKHPVKILIEDYNDIIELIIDEDLDKFKSYEDKKEDRLKLLDEYASKQSPWHNLIKAEIKFHWGLVNFKFNNELTAAWNINQAHSLIKENNKKFPDFTPNLKTIGLFHIVVGSLPENYQWIMNKLGFKGDIKLGLKELEECANTNNILQHEANLALLYIKAHLLNEYEPIIELLEQEHRKKYNLAINYTLVSLLNNTNQTEKAIEYINNRTQDERHPKFFFYHYKLGSCYFQKGEYEMAIKEFNYFLKNYKGQNYLKGTYYKMTLCYYFLNDKKKQMEMFEKIDEEGWKIGDEDKYAQKFYNVGVFPNKTLAKARYLSDGGYFNQALQLLEKETNITSNEEVTELLYRKGRIFDLMKQYEQAIQSYKSAIILSEKKELNDLYFAPNACLKLGIIYLNKDEKDTALKWLKQAIAYKNHEYENSIELKAKSLLNKLEQ